ncbi:MAG: hypothetical protein KDE31_10780, partial [Caldilineaceae bacterium]|nr:hypothetical protein [Caldilineaceae bacterium]
MYTLQIKLLGGFTVMLEGELVTQFRSSKARALLAYLAMQPEQTHARTTLATLLWGEQQESAARTNLRIELSNLKKILQNHPALVITRHAVCLQLTAVTVDAVTFQQTTNRFLALPPETQGVSLIELATALEHYQGEFLAGFQLEQAEAFDEWRLLRQEEFHELAMQALSVLQQHHATQGNWPALAMAARRQLVFVPWQESAHRNLMQALAAQDQRQAALDQYAKCRAILQTELGVEPALATQALANRLQQSIQISPPLAEPIARHNLPKQLKSLVGRAEDIVRLHQLVRTTPLVTLLGIGGVGKSRLAQAVGQRARHDFPDGIWFVPLANIEASKNASERIALAIAATIGFALTDLQHPLTELTTYLADQRLLLILDNWDHLTPAAEALFSYLRQTTVHVLATSRVRLWLEEEVVLQLAGLPE